MKRIFFTAVLIITISICASAQNWSVGVGAGGGLPIGDFSNLSSFGFGGTVWGAYSVDQNIVLMARSGYLAFSGKDITGFGSTIKTSYGAIPILVGGRYYFMPEGDTRVYGAAELGLYALNATAKTTITSGGSSTTVEASSSETKFSLVPTLGAKFKAGDKMNVDVYANYTYVSTAGTALTWIGFGVGLEFPLQ